MDGVEWAGGEGAGDRKDCVQRIGLALRILRGSTFFILSSVAYIFIKIYRALQIIFSHKKGET